MGGVGWGLRSGGMVGWVGGWEPVRQAGAASWAVRKVAMHRLARLSRWCTSQVLECAVVLQPASELVALCVPPPRAAPSAARIPACVPLAPCCLPRAACPLLLAPCCCPHHRCWTAAPTSGCTRCWRCSTVVTCTRMTRCAPSTRQCSTGSLHWWSTSAA